MAERFSVVNIVYELLLKGGVKLSVVCVCIFSNRCCQRNVYTHSDHSHCFEHSVGVGSSMGGPRCYR